MDRTEVELSGSPDAHANDTSVWSIGNFLAWTARSSPASVTRRNISAAVLTVPELEYSHDKKGAGGKSLPLTGLISELDVGAPLKKSWAFWGMSVLGGAFHSDSPDA